MKRLFPYDTPPVDHIMDRRQALKKAGALVLGAAAIQPFVDLVGFLLPQISPRQATAATKDFSLNRGEAVLEKNGLSWFKVKSGVPGQTIFSGNYKARGWVGGTTVTDSIGRKYHTVVNVKKLPSAIRSLEVYQTTLIHVCKVIANGHSVGITMRSIFLKGGSKYIPLADYANRWYKTKDSDGYVSVYDFRQRIAMIRGTKGREKSYFCNSGLDCPRIGPNTHSAGELLGRLLASKQPNPKLQWLKKGEPCQLVVSEGGSLHFANIFHTQNGLMMALPGRGTFGVDYKEEGKFTLSMPGESFGLEKSKVLKINLTKK